MKPKLIYTLIIFAFVSCITNQCFAQLPSQTDNGQYAIAQMIAAKAQQFKLGAIHSESPKMRPTAGKGGYFLRYEKGWVYYNPKLNKAFAIWGDIMKKWSLAGYETGWLGFPITDHSPTPNRSGFFVAFDNGSIYNNPQTGSHFVGGAFREEWARRGWENSVDLGFPKTDEVEIFINGYTRYQQFEKGTLFFGNGKSIFYVNNPNATTPENSVAKITKTMDVASVKQNIVVSNKLRSLRTSYYSNFNIVAKPGNPSRNIKQVNGNKAAKITQSGNVKCITEYKSLDIQNPDQDVLSGAAISNISLGAIYKLADFTNGSFNNLGENENNRNPIRLSVEQTSLNTLVNEPTVDNLNSAFGSLLEKKSVTALKNKEILKATEVFSASDLNINAAVSYWSPGVDIKDELKFNQKSSSHKFLLDFSRESFIVTARPTITGKFFKDETLNQRNDAVYVDKITFGARLLVYFEKTEDLMQIENDLSGGYATLDANTKQKYEQQLKNTKFTIFSYGLPGDLVLPKEATGFNAMWQIVTTAMESFKNQEKYITNFGKPISYSLKFLNGDVAVCTGKMENLPQTTCSTENWKWKVEFAGLFCEKTDDSPSDGDEINGWIDITGWNSDGTIHADELNRKGDKGFNKEAKFKPYEKNQMINQEMIFNFNQGDDNAYIQIRSRIWDAENTKNDYSSSSNENADIKKFYLRDIKIKTPENNAQYGAIPALELHPGNGKYYVLVKLTPISN